MKTTDREHYGQTLNPSHFKTTELLEQLTEDNKGQTPIDFKCLSLRYPHK